jgi:hypothetical protein
MNNQFNLNGANGITITKLVGFIITKTKGVDAAINFW